MVVPVRPLAVRLAPTALMICCWLLPPKWQPSWLPSAVHQFAFGSFSGSSVRKVIAERVLVVLHHLRQVVGERVVGIVLQVVRAVRVPGRAAALRHPVRRRIGERFEDRVRVALDDPPQDVASGSRRRPSSRSPTRSGSRASRATGPCARAPGSRRRRCCSGRCCSQARLAGSTIGVDDRVAGGRAPAADAVRPPAQAGSPALERLAARRRIDLHQRGAGRRRDRPPRRVGACVGDAAGAAEPPPRPPAAPPLPDAPPSLPPAPSPAPPPLPPAALPAIPPPPAPAACRRYRRLPRPPRLRHRPSLRPSRHPRPLHRPLAHQRRSRRHHHPLPRLLRCRGRHTRSPRTTRPRRATASAS